MKAPVRSLVGIEHVKQVCDQINAHTVDLINKLPMPCRPLLVSLLLFVNNPHSNSNSNSSTGGFDAISFTMADVYRQCSGYCIEKNLNSECFDASTVKYNVEMLKSYNMMVVAKASINPDKV